MKPNEKDVIKPKIDSNLNKNLSNLSYYQTTQKNTLIEKSENIFREKPIDNIVNVRSKLSNFYEKSKNLNTSYNSLNSYNNYNTAKVLTYNDSISNIKNNESYLITEKSKLEETMNDLKNQKKESKIKNMEIIDVSVKKNNSSSNVNAFRSSNTTKKEYDENFLRKRLNDLYNLRNFANTLTNHVPNVTSNYISIKNNEENQNQIYYPVKKDILSKEINCLPNNISNYYINSNENFDDIEDLNKRNYKEDFKTAQNYTFSNNQESMNSNFHSNEASQNNLLDRDFPLQNQQSSEKRFKEKLIQKERSEKPLFTGYDPEKDYQKDTKDSYTKSTEDFKLNTTSKEYLMKKLNEMRNISY